MSFKLDQTLQEAGEAGQALRLTRLRHFGELIRDLTHNLDTEAPLHSTEEVTDPTKDGIPDVNSDDFLAQLPVRIALSEYGNEASLHAVRMEALEVFETTGCVRRHWYCGLMWFSYGDARWCSTRLQHSKPNPKFS